MKKRICLLSAILLLCLCVLSGCGEKQNPLVGTWKVQSIDGSSSGYKVRSEVTFRDGGKVYDTDDFLSYMFNDDYPVTSWDTISNSTLILTGMFGDTVKVSYSISGKTLTLKNSYGQTAILQKQ